MKILNIIAWILLLIGGINWLVIGIFSVNAVSFLVGGITILLRIIYVLVGLSALWLIASPFITRGKISLWDE
jgi:uncharacterized membrane protein YuzA (DUF378 family)